MKNNNADKVLIEKLGSLDTLSGGIVYGKEEAWEKLQGRLDAKPAKSIVLKYGMAAALVILLGFTGFYFYFAKENVNTKAQLTKSTAIQPPVAPTTVIQQPETTAVYTSVNIKEAPAQKRNYEQVPHTSRVWDTLATQVPEVVVENKIVIQPTSSGPVAKPMKVVHINDLENGTTETSEGVGIVSNSSSGMDLARLPVVNITDLIREDFEVKRILNENRLSYGQWPFSKPGRAATPHDIYSDPIQKHSFQIKFHPDNLRLEQNQ